MLDHLTPNPDIADSRLDPQELPIVSRLDDVDLVALTPAQTGDQLPRIRIQVDPWKLREVGGRDPQAMSRPVLCDEVDHRALHLRSAGLRLDDLLLKLLDSLLKRLLRLR